jgi:hypothetical protein
MPEMNFTRPLLAALVSAFIVISGALVFLSRELPEEAADPVLIEAVKLKFVMGSGRPQGQQMLVEDFKDGYALLSSGPVSIQAEKHRLLTVNWDPLDNEDVPKFFWRRKSDPQNVLQIPIFNPGTEVIRLWLNPDWRGEISEFGFLFPSREGSAIALGPSTLVSDNLTSHLSLVWRAWTTFEPWSMKSVNFITGGGVDPAVPLPAVLAAWFVLSLLILSLSAMLTGNPDLRNLILSSVIFFLTAWILLDLRWATNNIREIRNTWETQWPADEHQRLLDGFDGWLYGHIKRLKDDVLPDETSRILIIGYETAVPFYFLAKAKYHLAPHSSHVARQLGGAFSPTSVDYFVYIGKPGNIVRVPGWDESYERALRIVDSSEYGIVFSARK